MSPRSQAFSHPSFEPFADHPDINIYEHLVSAPLRFFNPTRARYAYGGGSDGWPKGGEKEDGEVRRKHKGREELEGVHYRWRSRDNRKGRHTIALSPSAIASAAIQTPAITSTLSSTFRGIKRMFTYYPIWDASYLVAQCFVWGSAIFVLNGLFYWLPVVAPSTEFPHEEDLGAGITSFVGTVFFQVGVTLLLLEAVNVNRTGCFGWAIEQVWEDLVEGEEDGKTSAKADGEANGVNSGDSTANGAPRTTPASAPARALMRLEPAIEKCTHHHPNKRSLFAFHRHDHATESQDTASSSAPQQQTDSSGRPWIWWPSGHDLRTYYIHEVGFIAAVIYFVSGTIFWIIGFTSLPGVYENLSEAAIWGAFWTPDILGSIGFVLGSYLIMLETQANWYTPAPHILGWHIGLWNVIGSIGFTLSACFGIAYQATETSWLLYQSDLSTTWGSAAFLIASVAQWYESVNKHVVEKM